MFVIEDEWHAELLPGEHATRAEALEELRRIALVAWDARPNQAPCTSWRTCGRLYEIVDYDKSVVPWVERSREAALEIDASGVRWLCEPPG